MFGVIDGIRCNEVEGALYAFPQITLPAGAVAAAKAAGKQPDTFYCLELLQATGIVVVPGSGFVQKAYAFLSSLHSALSYPCNVLNSYVMFVINSGTWHFRTTILPAERLMEDMLNRLETFHRSFIKRYTTA